MFKSCKLQITQPKAGTKPNGDSNKEKWLIVNIQRNILSKYLTEQRMIEWFARGYTVWGTYSILDNNPDSGNSSYYIGGSQSKEYKIWRFHLLEQTISFGVVENWVGGGLAYGESELKVANELDLYSAIQTNSGFEPVGNKDYGNGFANIPSWVQPFEKRTLYWTWV